MKYTIRIHPNAKQEKILEKSAHDLEVWVRAPAHEGKANDRLVELVSTYLNIPKSRITLVKGHVSKNKILEIG